jgi:serine/threonine protein kinase
VKVASALESAHRAGILHRDIKPSNILLTAYGMPVLSDFGIAASVSAREGVEVFAMSVPWSAPEIIDERTSGSVPAEVWSLGATVYSLLAGRSPFERPSHSDNTRDHLKSRIRRATYTPIGRSDVPPGLEDVLRRALAKNPADRFASAADFAHALQLVQYDTGMPVTPLELAEAVPLPAREPDATPAFVRPRVEYESHRRKPPRHGRAADRAPSDDLPESPAPRRTALIWSVVVGGAIIVIGAAAAVIVSVI